MITPDVLKAALEELFQVPFDEIAQTLVSSREVATQFHELAPIVREQWREKEQAQLKQAWGDEYDTVYSYLADTVFPTLPQHEQQLYNNAAGLQVLAQRYRPQIEQQLQTTQPTPTPVAPDKLATPGSLLQNKTPSAQQAAPAYKQSAILAMTPEAYDAERAAIEQAFASGAVEFDV